METDTANLLLTADEQQQQDEATTAVERTAIQQRPIVGPQLTINDNDPGTLAAASSTLAAASSTPAVASSSISQQQQPVAHSKATAKHRKHIKTAATFVKWASRGSFLPLVQDKMRNNVRHRGLLMALYMTLVCFVTVVIVLSFLVAKPTGSKFFWVVPPPKMVVIGQHWTPVSVRLMSAGEAVVNAPIYLSVSPVKPIQITAPVGNLEIPIDQLECLASILKPMEARVLSNFRYCTSNPYYDPRSRIGHSGVMGPFAARTNDYGVASFDNVTLAYGQPGDYLVVAAHVPDVGAGGGGKNPEGQQQYTEAYAMQFLTVQSAPESIVVETLGPIKNPLRVGDSVTVKATVTWRSLYQPSCVAANLVTLDLLNRPFVREFETEGAEVGNLRAQVPYPAWGGQPITAGENQREIAFDQPFSYAQVHGRDGDLGCGPILQPFLVNTSLLPPIELIGEYLYQATLYFSSRVRGANVKFAHIAVSFMGKYALVPTAAFSSPWMFPNTIVPPLQIISNVDTVAASVILSDSFSHIETISIGAQNNGIMNQEEEEIALVLVEGTPFNIQITAKDAVGGAIAGRLGYAHVTDSPLNPGGGYGYVFQTPATVPLLKKELLVQTTTALTDEDGQVMIKGSRFTVKGATGYYRLTAAVDGIPATWSITLQNGTKVFESPTTTTPTTFVRKYLSVKVKSRVRQVTIRRGIAPWRKRGEDYELIGTGWVAPPSVRLLGSPDLNSSVEALQPIPGKVFGITTKVKGVIVSSMPSLTDDDGWATANEPVVLSSTIEGPVPFDLVVDGEVVGALTVNIYYNPPGKNVTTTTNTPMTTTQAPATTSSPLLSSPSNLGTTEGSSGGSSSSSSNEDDDSARWQCSALELVSFPSIGYSQVPVPIHVRVLNKYGDPVPNTYFYYRFHPSTTIPNVSSFVPVMVDAAGEVKSFFRFSTLDPLALVFIFGCFDSPYQAMVSVMIVPRVYSYAVNVRYTSNITYFDVTVKSNSSLLSPQSPISVVPVLMWLPQVNIALDQADVMACIRPAWITSSNQTIITTQFTCPELRGPYGYLLIIDGSIAPVWGVRSPAPVISSLVLIRSAFGATPLERKMSSVSVDFQETFPYQPLVRVLDSEGNPVSGVQLFVQIGIQPNGTNSIQDVQWFSLLANASNFSTAAIVSLASPQEGGVSFPYSKRSDTAGEAEFSPLMFLGAQIGPAFRIRYCFSTDMPTNFTGNGVSTAISPSICVAENDVLITFPLINKVIITTNPPQLAAVPGFPLPDFDVNIRWWKGTMSIGICTVSSPSPFFVDTNPAATEGRSSFFFSANKTAVEFHKNEYWKGFHFLPFTPDTLAEIWVHCPGGSVPIPVVVSAIPGEIEILSPTKRDVAVGSKLNLVAAAVLYGAAASGAGGYSRSFLFNQWFDLTLTRLDENCAGDGCGELTSASTTYASTGKGFPTTGLFEISFRTVTTGNYTLTVKSGSGVSKKSLPSVVNNEISRLQAAFGSTKRNLRKEYEVAAPELLDTIDILLLMSEGAAMRAEIKVPQNESESSSGSAVNQYQQLSEQGGTVAIAQELFGSLDDNEEEMVDIFQKKRAQPSLTTLPFTVWNAVASIEVVNDPGAYRFQRRIAGSVERIMSRNVEVWFSNGGSTDPAPAIRAFSPLGEPAANVSVTVEVVDENGAPKSGGYLDLAFDQTNDDGNFSLAGSVFRASEAGNFYFKFSVQGSPANRTKVPVVIQFQAQTAEETMKYLSGLAVLACSPLYAASVPHTRKIYIVVATVVALAFGVGTLVVVGLYWDQYATNFFSQAYFIFLCLLMGFVMVGQLYIAVIEFLSWLAGFRAKRAGKSVSAAVAWYRMTEDEQKALSVWEYTEFIVQARVDVIGHPSSTTGSSTFIGRLKTSASNLAKKSKDTIKEKAHKLDDALELELMAQQTEEDATKERVSRNVERPKLILPKGIDAAFLPMNLLIVISLSLVLCFVMNFFCVYSYYGLRDYLKGWLEYLPTEVQTGQLADANQKLQQSLGAAVTDVIKKDPQYGFLANVIAPLNAAGVLQYLNTLRQAIEKVVNSLQLATILGMIAANLAVLITVGMCLKTTPQLIRDARRGLLNHIAEYSRPFIPRVEPYIGLHCLHFIFLFNLVMWPTWLIVLIFSNKDARLWVIDKLGVFIIATLASVAISLMLRYLVVTVFFVDGWAVVRPEIYAIYAFVELVLGVFTGVADTIARWIQSIVFMTVCFAKLDVTIFPGKLMILDRAHRGYCAMVAAEAKNGNPIMNCVASWMLVDQELKRLYTEAKQQQQEQGASSSSSSSPVASSSASAPTPFVSPPPSPPAVATISSPSSTSFYAFLTTPDPPGFTVPVSVDTFCASHPPSIAVNLARMWLRSMLHRPVNLRLPSAPEDDGEDHFVDKVDKVATAVGERKEEEEGTSSRTDPQQHNNIQWRRRSNQYRHYHRHEIIKDALGSATFDAAKYVQWRSHRRVAARFWLWLVLTFNPSLVKYRKHNLYEWRDKKNTQQDQRNQHGDGDGGDEERQDGRKEKVVDV